jgi:hypothetical protein
MDPRQKPMDLDVVTLRSQQQLPPQRGLRLCETATCARAKVLAAPHPIPNGAGRVFPFTDCRGAPSAATDNLPRLASHVASYARDSSRSSESMVSTSRMARG